MTNLLSAAAGAGNLGTLFVQLTADAQKLVKGFNEAEAKIQSSSAIMLRQATLLSAGMTAALAVVGTVAVREAMKFEDSFTGVRKTVDATEAEFAQLEASFRNMSKSIPASVHDINKVAEAAGQLGVQTPNLVTFTKVMIDLGNTTNLQGEMAAMQLARIANITKMSQKDFDRLGAAIVGLGNDGASSESEIVDMAMRVAAAGSQVGMTQAQILGFSSALSSVGIAAEAGGTAISQAMILMAKSIATGGEELKVFARVSGKTTEQFSKDFKENAAESVIQFMEGLGRLSASGADVFTMMEQMGMDGIRMTDVMLRASGAGDLFRKSLETGTQAWKDNTALVDEANKRYNTFSSQLTISWNIVKDFFITVGQQLVPTLKALNNMFREATTGNTQFDAGFKTFISQTGPVFLKVVGAIGDAIYGWQLLVKLAQVQFSAFSYAAVITFDKVANAVASVMEGAAGAAVAGVNNAIRAMNLLLPKSKELSEITWEFKIDRSKFSADTAAFKTALEGTVSELGTMLEKGRFSERLEAEYKKVTEVAVKENVKLVESAKATNQALAAAAAERQRMEADSAKALEMMKGIESPGMSLGSGLSGLDDPAMAQLDALQKEKDTTAKHLETLRNLHQQDLVLTEEVQKKKLMLLEQYSDRARRLQVAQAQLVLGTASNMFEDLTTVAEKTAGKQSSIYKAMFAASKAFAIAEATVKIAQGIANAASVQWPANLVAMASVAAATASLVSNIQAVQLEFGGGKAKGGSVDAGTTYLVGEKGPELFTPAGRGNITPNNKLGGSVKVNVYNQAGASVDVQEKDTEDGKQIDIIVKRVKQEVAGEIRDGRGDVDRAMRSSYSLSRAGK